MCGSHWETPGPRPPPPAPADTNEITETRDPVTSPPLPVPDRIARGQPPPRLAAPFLGPVNPDFVADTINPAPRTTARKRRPRRPLRRGRSRETARARRQ